MPETVPAIPRTFWSLGLTPAQSWIAESRRSRDLLAGSRILAWLMGRLLVHLKQREATVRLPELAEEELQNLAGSYGKALAAGSTGVSNHASGWVEQPLEQAEELFSELESLLASIWSDLCAGVSREARKSAANLWAVAGSAIGVPACPLQLVWALREAVITDTDEEGLREVDAMYAAVKRSRAIPVHAGAPVRKCGQCGKRAAMGGVDPKLWRQFQDQLAALEEVQQGLRFDAAELLCPVCALRRLAGYLQEEAFPSTSAIAASEWLWRIESAKDLRVAVRSLEDAAKKVPGYEPKWADRAPLYYRRSADREAREARTNDSKLAVALDTVREKQKSLLAAIRSHNRRYPAEPVPESPPEYLAVLMFDGDDMGRKLREHLAELPRQVVEFQRQLHGLLSQKEPWGQPFYLGGDEGLILAPIGMVLTLAGKIQQLWEETAGAKASKSTLSLGIALFDRERPLYSAIETARRSLERAKQVPKKQAVAVSVQTASGSAWTAVARWGDEWNRLTAAVELIRQGTLASGWPYDVERFLRTLPDQAFRSGHDTREAIREEVKRLTFRRVTKQTEKEAAWRDLKGEKWWSEQPADEELVTLADRLHLVAFLARQGGIP